MNPQNKWAEFFVAKLTDKAGKLNTYYKSSIIYGGVKWVMNDLKESLRWQVGDGSSICVWTDRWCAKAPILESLRIDPTKNSDLKCKVSDLISKGT